MNNINVGDFHPIFKDPSFPTKTLMHGDSVALKCVRC